MACPGSCRAWSKALQRGGGFMGIYVWKEFRAAPKGVAMLLNGTLLCYLIGIGLLLVAR